MEAEKATPATPLMMLDSMTSGVVAVDLESRVTFVNAALAQRLGLDKQSCEGRPASDLFRSVVSNVSPQHTPLSRLHSLLDSPRTQSREVQCTEGGRIVHLREDSAPLRDARGQVVGRLFAYHDLSWEKTMDQMKSDFISIASHELRTPMTSIKGAIDLILNGYTSEASTGTVELLGVARTACERMIRLINDLLDLSKIEAGQIGLKLVPLNLADLAERSMRGLKLLAAGDQISVTLKAPSDLPEIHADGDRMEQVITNLVSNAIKYSPAQGEVTVELSADEGWVFCGVSDQGCGIKEEDLDRIFGKFQQASSPLRGASTGLGLAITRALVLEHGGNIWAESRLGQGSRFIFRLPLAVPASRDRR
jgi:PAS domain S-box-containing protein